MKMKSKPPKYHKKIVGLPSAGKDHPGRSRHRKQMLPDEVIMTPQYRITQGLIGIIQFDESSAAACQFCSWRPGGP